MLESNPQQTVATRQSWFTAQPLPERRALISFEREFTHEEYEIIRFGLVPEVMEDKWFIFLEEDVLYFHRSWTGFCVYQLRLRKHGANYAVAEALASRESTQYTNTDEGYDQKLLTFLVENLLLGKRSTFPLPAGVAPGIATGLYHHHVAGVGPKARDTAERMSAPRWLWEWFKFIRGLIRK